VYDLPHLPLFSILAVMSGANLCSRTPAYSLIRYALHGLDVEAIAPHFRAHALLLAETLRSHWGTENRLHDVLDTALGEDAGRSARTTVCSPISILSR
jgi:hypothetical protein